MALLKFRVVGPMPIRDAVTKESVQTGGEVTLDDAPVHRPEAPNSPHAATLIDALIKAGCIEPLEAPKKAPKAD